jgi:triosephosphate isomerase (TIM)
MASKPLIIANWKMHKTIPEAVRFAMDLVKVFEGKTEADIVLSPPFTALRSVMDILKGSTIALSAQNLYWEDEGAYTGEVSAPLLVNAGCSYVILGHSERRKYFGETDEQIHKKLKAALAHNLIPILCVGETLSEREAGRTFTVVETQLERILLPLPKETLQKLVIAYEPVWATGTGKNASPAQAGEVHHHIRQFLKERLAIKKAERIRILYGGSVSPANTKALMIEHVIDGLLVGNAGLESESFIKIIQLACEGHQARPLSGQGQLSDKE